MSLSTLVLRDIPWPQLEEAQREAMDSVTQEPDRVVFIVSEPRPTFTFGRSAKASDRLWPPEELEKRGIAVHPVARGGKWTYHGPGQILVYPIMKLEARGYPRHGIRRFLGDFRRGANDYVKSLGVASQVGECPFGVFVGENKLVSFGIAVEKGISSHGLALYLNSQTTPFQGIPPCGVPGGGVTSLHQQGHLVSWKDAAEGLVESIKRSFKMAKS